MRSVILWCALLTVNAILVAMLTIHMSNYPRISYQLGSTMHLTETSDVLRNTSVFYRIDLESERNHTLSGGPMDYLKDYKNPCWMAKLDNLDPYLNNGYAHEVENYPGVGRFVPRDTFRRMNAVFQQRLKAGEGWRLRCLPLLYLVGVTKSGTTDLFKNVIAHPDIVTAAEKEPMWWNRHTIGSGRTLHVRPYTFSSYLDLFDEAAHTIWQHADNSSGTTYHNKITIDATPAYLWDYDGWQMIPGNLGLDEPKYTMADALRAIVPQAKIVVILRNPTDRLYSQYRMRSPSNTPEHFHKEAVDAVTKMLRCIGNRSARRCAYDLAVNPREFVHEGGVFIRASMYHVFLSDWLALFPRDQVHVMRAEDYYADRSASMTKVFDFLDLIPLDKTSMHAMNESDAANSIEHFKGRSQDAMLDQTRILLDSFFRPYNKQLSDLLKDDKFLWSEFQSGSGNITKNRDKHTNDG